jgi:tubulin polyglutamylase TTLL6/13
MYALARKNLLAKNLLAIQKHFPDDYQFFPKTWVLPADIKSFRE